MRHSPKTRIWIAFWFAALMAATPESLYACAVCYGESNSPLAIGLNWGIASLLGVVVLVLGGIAGFFIYLARRSAGAASGSPAIGAPSSPSGN
jgi:hypothetical protein